MRSGTTTLLQHMNAINVNVRWEKMAQSSNQNARRPISSGSNRGLSLCKHFCSASEFEATRANGGQTSALCLVGYTQEFSLYFGTRHACWVTKGRHRKNTLETQRRCMLCLSTCFSDVAMPPAQPRENSASATAGQHRCDVLGVQKLQRRCSVEPRGAVVVLGSLACDDAERLGNG